MKKIFTARILYLIFFFILFQLEGYSQELRQITPVGIEASSFFKDDNYRVHYTIRKYEKYVKDNSPKYVLDGKKISSWSPNNGSSNQIGAWIKLRYPYPVIISSIKLLTGYHIDRGTFRQNKRVKKILISNEFGESKKFTFKDTRDFNTFTLKFKKAYKELKVTILAIENETSRNKEYSVGFAEISTNKKIFNEKKISDAINSGKLSNVRKVLKPALKYVDDPNAIITNGVNPIEYAVLVGNQQISTYLWDKKFRLQNASNKSLRIINSKTEMIFLIGKLQSVRKKIANLKLNLTNPKKKYDWETLEGILKSLKGEFNLIFDFEKKEIKLLVEQKRKGAAKEYFLAKIQELSIPIINSNISLKNAIKIEKLVNFESKKYKYLTVSDKSIVNEEKRKALSRVLKSLSNSEIEIINQWGINFETLEKGNKWFNSFNKKYDLFQDKKEMKQVKDYFLKNRELVIRKNASVIRKQFQKLNSFSEVDKYTKAINFVKVTNHQVTGIIEKNNSLRKKEIRLKDLESSPSHRWFYHLQNSKSYSHKNLLKNITEVKLVVNGNKYTKESSKALLQNAAKRRLQEMGIKINSKSTITLEVSKSITPKVYTSSINGRVQKEKSLFEWKIDLQLLTPGFVHRKGAFYPSLLRLSTATITRLVVLDDQRVVYKYVEDFDLLFNEVFKKSYVKSKPTSNKNWFSEMEQNYERISEIHQHSDSQDLKRVNLKGVSGFQYIHGIHNQDNPIFGFEIAHGAMKNTQVDALDKLFGGMLLGSIKWEPRKRWARGLKVVGLDNYDAKNGVELIQIIGGNSLNLDEDIAREVHGLMSRSYLVERDCVFLLNRNFVRSPAYTLVYSTNKSITNKALNEIVRVTNESINHFKYLIKRGK